MHRLGTTCRAAVSVASAVAVVSASALAQGDNGFLRGAGRTDAAITYAFDSYDHFWVGSNRVEDPGVGEVERESINLWIAHGITDDLDLVGSISYVESESDGTVDFDDEADVQDMVLGAKWRVFERRLGPGAFTVCAAPAVKIPMSDYEDNNVTAIGDGQVDYRGRAILQYRADCGAFLAVESGFDYRTEQPGNEVPIHVTLGVPVTQYVTVMPFYSTVTADSDTDIGDPGFDFPSIDEETEVAGVSLYARVTEMFGVTAGWKTTLDGKNTGDVDGFWGGVVLRF